MDNSNKLVAQDTQDDKKTKQKHNTICVGNHYAKINTNDVDKNMSPPTNNWRQRRNEHYFMRKSQRTSQN